MKLPLTMQRCTLPFVVAAFLLCNEAMGQVQPGPTFTVTDLGDYSDGACTTDDCTLRDALIAANADPDANTIDFAAGLSGTISLDRFNPFTASHLAISAPVTIIGPGARLVAIDGASLVRVFFVDSADVSISGLTITNGNPFNANGGAILNQGNLTLTACTISNSKTSDSSGGNGGGLFNGSNATASLVDCTISGNTAESFGGGVYNDGTFSATNCTFSGNTALRGGGLISRFNGGVSSSTILNCTITNNTASSTGAGIGDGGGGYFAEGGPQQHSVGNSIIAGNTNSINPDVRGQFTSSGNNLIGSSGSSSTGFVNEENGDKVGTNLEPLSAEFGSFANHGGPTNTWSILDLSPAKDGGNDALAPLADQRGHARVDASDMGAFEFGSSGLRITGFARVGNDFVFEFREAVAGSSYGLERKFDLTEADWVPDPDFAPFTAIANGNYSFIYTDGAVLHLPPVFYRLVLIP